MQNPCQDKPKSNYHMSIMSSDRKVFSKVQKQSDSDFSHTIFESEFTRS